MPPAPAFPVHIVDDDASIVRGMLRLFAAEDLPAQGHPSAEAFLDNCDPDTVGCVLLDLGLPALDGLDLQERLRDLAPDLPVIFLTGVGDVPASVRAMKAGALDFLIKPVDPAILLSALRAALLRRRENLLRRREADAARQEVARLTPREAEVLAGVAAGHLNKQIGAALGMAEKTVKVHRARGLEKLGVRSVAELVAYAPLLPPFSAKIVAAPPPSP